MRVRKSFLGSLAGLAVLALAVGNGCSGDDETPPTGVGGMDGGADASKDGAAGGARGGSSNVGGSDSGAGGSSEAGPDGSQEADTSTGTGGADSGAGGSTGVGGAEAGLGGNIVGVGGADSGAGGTGTGTGGADSGTGGTDSGPDASPPDAALETGTDAAPDVAPDAIPDAGPADVVTDVAAAGLVVCNFSPADAGDAGVSELCDLQAGGGGTHDQGTVAASTDDAVPGSATPGSLEFTTTFQDPDTGDTVRLRTETSTPTSWAGRTTLRAKVKVVTAGELQSIRLGVANSNSGTTYRYGAAYDISQLPLGQWTDVVFDMTAGDAGVNINSVGKIVLQLAARAADAGDGGTEATVIRVDDIEVQ